MVEGYCHSSSSSSTASVSVSASVCPPRLICERVNVHDAAEILQEPKST